MVHHPSYNEQATSIQHALRDCENKLSLLMLTVHKQRWKQLDYQVHCYESAIQSLKKKMQYTNTLPSKLLNQFQYLSTQQRRVMRSIHQHMQQTSDDLNSIDQGISKLKKTTQLQASFPSIAPLQK